MSGTEQGQEEHGTRSSIGWAAACRKLGWILQEAARSRDEISTRRPADAATRQQQSAAGAPRQTPDAGAPRQPAVSCCRAICGSSRLSSERFFRFLRRRRPTSARQTRRSCGVALGAAAGDRQYCRQRLGGRRNARVAHAHTGTTANFWLHRAEGSERGERE